MLNILFGKSATGKDTLLNRLVSEKGYIRVVSVTTRPARAGERNAVDYHFVSREKFQKLIDEDALIEYRAYNTLVNGKPDVWYYGSLKQDFSNDVYINVLDIEGIKSILDIYGKENIRCVYVSTNDEIREQRAISRGSFDKTEWDRRAADDAVKFSRDKVLEVADAVYVNDGMGNPEGFDLPVLTTIGELNTFFMAGIPRFSDKDKLIDYVYDEYIRYDEELSSLFFDIEVEMKKSDLLDAYALLQHRINGDSVVCQINGEFTSDFSSFSSVYRGNCRDFLESLNGREEMTGIYRFVDNEQVDVAL